MGAHVIKCGLSPYLIALMKDQVQNLNDRGIKALCIHAGMTRRERRELAMRLAAEEAARKAEEEAARAAAEEKAREEAKAKAEADYRAAREAEKIKANAANGNDRYNHKHPPVICKHTKCRASVLNVCQIQCVWDYRNALSKCHKLQNKYFCHLVKKHHTKNYRQ